MLCEHNIPINEPDNPPSPPAPSRLPSLPPSPGGLLPTLQPVRPKSSQATQRSLSSERFYLQQPYLEASNEYPDTQQLCSRAYSTSFHDEPSLGLTTRKRDPFHNLRTAARIISQPLQPFAGQQDLRPAVTLALERCDPLQSNVPLTSHVLRHAPNLSQAYFNPAAPPSVSCGEPKAFFCYISPCARRYHACNGLCLPTSSAGNAPPLQ